jgi:RimJ/RimL family protein N-acetyltransferase
MLTIKLKRLTTKDIFDISIIVKQQIAQKANIAWPFNREAALNFIENYNTWGIWVNGSILAGAIEIKEDCETAYFVATNYQNQGIATEAVRQVLELFADRQLYALINPNNKASLRVAQKANMRIKFID